EGALERVAAALRNRAVHVRPLLQRHVPEARDILRHLLVERLGCSPIKVESVCGYRFSGRGELRSTAHRDACPTSHGSPNGICYLGGNSCGSLCRGTAPRTHRTPLTSPSRGWI